MTIFILLVISTATQNELYIVQYCRILGLFFTLFLVDEGCANDDIGRVPLNGEILSFEPSRRVVFSCKDGYALQPAPGYNLQPDEVGSLTCNNNQWQGYTGICLVNVGGYINVLNTSTCNTRFSSTHL